MSKGITYDAEGSEAIVDSSALASLSGASKRRCSAESSSDSAVPPITTSASLSPAPAKQPRKSVGEFVFYIIKNLMYRWFMLVTVIFLPTALLFKAINFIFFQF